MDEVGGGGRQLPVRQKQDGVICFPPTEHGVRRGPSSFSELFLIVVAVVFAVIVFVLVLSVSLYKCRKERAGPSGKENAPLNVA